jgi:hypothetical protein
VRIDRIEKDSHHDDIVIVTAEDGCQVRYRMDSNGVLRPGRVWQCMTPPNTAEQYVVNLFIPLSDGSPEVLSVRKC